MGVSRSTVQRYCDDGTLRQHRTVGGHRRIRATDVADWLESSGRKVRVDRSHSGDSGQRRNPDISTLLLRSEWDQINKYISKLILGSKSVADIFDELLLPAIHKLKEQRRANKISEIQFGTSLLNMRVLIGRLELATHHLGKFTTAAIGLHFGDPNDSFSSSMLSIALSDCGIKSTFISKMQLSEPIVNLVRNSDAQIAWMDFAKIENLELAINWNFRIFEALPPGTRLVVSGADLSPDVRRLMKFDFFGESVQQIVQFAQRNSSRLEALRS